MSSYWHENALRFAALLALWTSAVGVGASVAQSPATVTVQVRLPSGAMKTGLRIRAIPRFTGGTSVAWKLGKGDFNFTDLVYSHTFYSLPPGQYSFVVCDGLAYIPGLQTRTVQSGPSSVDFLLQSPKDSKDIASPTLKGPDGQPVGRGEPVFLKDVATGCMLANGNVEGQGVAKFSAVPSGNYGFDSEADDRDPRAP
jgi:hypothetical protein